MRVLEARHHPAGQTADFIVVGRVLCQEQLAIVEPDPQLVGSPAPQTLLASLRHIAAMSVPRPFEYLRSLNNRFWSFVEIGASGGAGRDASTSQSRR